MRGGETMISHPYLHELFKACLLYDAKEVSKKLQLYYPSWKLVREWNIKSTHQEFRVLRKPWIETLDNEPDARKGDVVWVATRRDKKYGRSLEVAILHEVKTGNFDVNEIFRKYQNYRTPFGSVCGLTYLWVWGWDEVLSAQQPSEKVTNKIRYGGFIRLLPLDIIFPIVKKRIKEIGLCDELRQQQQQSAAQSQPQRRRKRQQQQHNSQSSQTSQTTLSEFEARELIKRARSILEGY